MLGGGGVTGVAWCTTGAPSYTTSVDSTHSALIVTTICCTADATGVRDFVVRDYVGGRPGRVASGRLPGRGRSRVGRGGAEQQGVGGAENVGACGTVGLSMVGPAPGRARLESATGSVGCPGRVAGPASPRCQVVAGGQGVGVVGAEHPQLVGEQFLRGGCRPGRSSARPLHEASMWRVVRVWGGRGRAPAAGR